MHTKFKENTLVALATLALIVIALGIGGTTDYDEQVLLHMPQHTYEQISADLRAQTGCDPTDHEIVIEYNNRTRQD